MGRSTKRQGCLDHGGIWWYPTNTHTHTDAHDVVVSYMCGHDLPLYLHFNIFPGNKFFTGPANNSPRVQQNSAPMQTHHHMRPLFLGPRVFASLFALLLALSLSLSPSRHNISVWRWCCIYVMRLLSHTRRARQQYSSFIFLAQLNPPPSFRESGMKARKPTQGCDDITKERPYTLSPLSPLTPLTPIVRL